MTTTPTPAERGLPDEATPTFEVGCRVQECGDFVSIFYTSGDTGRVVKIDRDGDLWVIWDNPKDDAQGDHGWCIPRNNCKLIAAAPSAPAEGVQTDLLNLRGDETNQEVLIEFIRVCREVKPVGQWPGERVCRAIENLMNGPRDFISPDERSPLRFGVGRGNEGGRLGLMGRELAQSQHSVSGDGKCIWPDCGHDTNQVGYSPGCTGAYCPNKVDPPAKTAPEPLAQGDVVAYIESYEVGGVQRSGLVWADHPANTPGHTFKPLYASPQPAAEVTFDRDRIFREATLLAVCYSLKRLVEGPGCERWQNANGFRLKDTPEWVEFYNTVTAISQFRTPAPITEEHNPPQPSAPVSERARELLAAEYRTHGWHEDAGRLRMGGDPTSFVEDDALRVITRLIEQGDEDTHVITELGRLLASIAVILKGPEPAGTAWSYHDLPALVASEVAEPRQVAAEMKAWAHTKMADQQSSRRDRMMVAEWAKRLLPESSFPVKDFDVEGMSITKEAAREAVKRVALEQALAQQRGECEASVSVKQKWPARHAFPKPDEHGNETGSIGEHAYAEGWNACLDEAKRMSGVPMPLKGKKGVVVAECTTPQPSASVGQRARELFNAMLSAPYGDTTIGDIVCAETTRNRLESARLPIIESALTTAAGGCGEVGNG